jgi:uncharacterized protein YuzE
VTITIGEIAFDNVSYDDEADVLYLHVGDPAGAVDFDESSEGHHLRFDRSGELVGLTIVNAKLLLERDGKIVITVRERLEIGPDALGAALTPTG